MFKLFLVLPFTLFLFACASISPESEGYIQANNWQAIGEYDGAEGLPEKSKAQLQALSDEYDAGVVDYTQYQDSYLTAVTVYCEPTNARMLAVLGKPYFGVCERFPNGLFFYQDWLNAKRDSAR